MDSASKKQIRAALPIALLVGVIGAGYWLWTSQGGADTFTGVTGGAALVEGREVLHLLNEVQSVSFDTAVFSDPAYVSLVDRSVDIEVRPLGRPNPFASFR
jgi:hypothetical protein